MCKNAAGVRPVEINHLASTNAKWDTAHGCPSTAPARLPVLVLSSWQHEQRAVAKVCAAVVGWRVLPNLGAARWLANFRYCRAVLQLTSPWKHSGAAGKLCAFCLCLDRTESGFSTVVLTTANTSMQRSSPCRADLSPVVRTLLVHSTILGKSSSTMTLALDLAHAAQGTSCCGQHHHTNKLQLRRRRELREPYIQSRLLHVIVRGEWQRNQPHPRVATFCRPDVSQRASCGPIERCANFSCH